MIDVTVGNGAVDFWGCILDEPARLALIVAAENTARVNRVNDHMSFIEPMSGMAFVLPKEVKPLPTAS